MGWQVCCISCTFGLDWGVEVRDYAGPWLRKLIGAGIIFTSERAHSSVG